MLTFDRLPPLFVSSTNNAEHRPCHLRLAAPAKPIAVNRALYDAPEQRYRRAGAYESVRENGAARLQINAQNCARGKTCDIEDPPRNITWTVPQGGDGPNYPNM